MRSVRKLVEIITASAFVTVAGACGVALEPAKPSDFNTSQAKTQELTENLQEDGVLNPLEYGFREVWKTQFSTKPLAVTFNDDEDQIVVLTEREKKQTLVGLARVGKKALLEKWDYQIPQGEVQNLIVHEDAVFFNTIDSVANGAVMDLYALNIRDGSENFRWSQSYPLDSQAPEIVGSYLRGLGVVKIDAQRITAAIIDHHGKVTASEQIITADFKNTVQNSKSATAGKEPLQEPEDTNLPVQADGIYQFRQNQVVLPNTAGSDGFTDSKNSRLIIFPMLKVLQGDWCEVMDTGTVCVEREARKLVLYDRGGEKKNIIPLSPEDPAMKYRFIGGLPDLELETLVNALAPNAKGSKQSEENRQESKLYGNSAVKPADTQTNTFITKNIVNRYNIANPKKGGPAGEENTEIIDAYLYGDEWLARNTWKGENAASCMATVAQAPFCIDRGALINVRTGEKLTADNTYVFSGSGKAATSFFTYENGMLAMLEADSTDSDANKKMKEKSDSNNPGGSDFHASRANPEAVKTES